MTDTTILQLYTLFQAPEFVDAIEAAMSDAAGERVLQMRAAVESGNMNDAALCQGAADALENVVDVLRSAANRFRPTSVG